MEIPKKNQKPAEDPSEVQLDIDKHWFISHRFLWWVAGCLFLVVVAGSYYWWQEIKTVDRLQVTADSKKDLTADWKTYTNTQYGFEFKFPKIWKEFSIANTTSDNFYDQNDNLVFSFEASNANSSQVSQNVALATKAGLKDAGKISGKQAYFDYDCCDNDYNSLVSIFVKDFPSKGLVTSIKYKKGLPEANQILSTFKFTDSADTSTWKTYTNSEYGFSFKYPIGWTMDDSHKASPGDPIKLSNSKQEIYIFVDPFYTCAQAKDLITPNSSSNLETDGSEPAQADGPGPGHIEENKLDITDPEVEGKLQIASGAEEAGGISYFYSLTRKNCDSLKQVPVVNFDTIDDFEDGTQMDTKLTEKILSTFKFTDSTVDMSPPAGGWKTYTNSQYGFSVSIPPDWTVTTPRDDTDPLAGVLDFLSAKTRISADKNCKGPPNDCNPEQLPYDMTFSTKDQSASEAILDTTSKEINGIKFTIYHEEGLFDYYIYQTVKNGKVYSFALFNQNDDAAILSSFKFTK